MTGMPVWLMSFLKVNRTTTCHFSRSNRLHAPPSKDPTKPCSRKSYPDFPSFRTSLQGQGWITSAHVRYYMTTKQNFRRERDLCSFRGSKKRCQQRWSKGVLFLHSTSTVLAFASQTIIWIRTSWILTFWERNVGWNMNYDLLCLRISSVATQAFSQVFVIK